MYTSYFLTTQTNPVSEKKIAQPRKACSRVGTNQPACRRASYQELFVSVFQITTSRMTLGQRQYVHTGKCIRRFGGIYAYCRYLIDRKW